jgi:hypothetical protein
MHLALPTRIGLSCILVLIGYASLHLLVCLAIR